MQELLKRKKGLRRKVLIVDDEYIEREILGAMLSDCYEVIYAADGAAALDIIRQEKYSLSLVLLDLHMPVLDGYSVLKVMHSDKELKHIPVIVLTSKKKPKFQVFSLAQLTLFPSHTRLLMLSEQECSTLSNLQRTE